MTESAFPQGRPRRTGPTRTQQTTTVAGTILTGTQLGGPVGAGFGLLAGVAINFLSHKETDPKLESRSDPRSAAWENNPYAFHTVGQEAAVGGKVLFALHKLADKPTDDSKRLDIVFGMNPGPLAEPTGQLFVLLNGHRYRFTREVAIAADDEFGVKPTPRHHWEPESGSIIEGCARAYCNFLADGTQGIELRNWAAKRPVGLSSEVVWTNPWDSSCMLNGIAWIHLILNFTEQGIKGNVHNRKSFTQRGVTRYRYRTPKARVQTGITSMPTVSFQIPKGKSLNDGSNSNAEAGSRNSAKFALWTLREMIGLDEAFIDSTSAIAAVTRCNATYTGKREGVDDEGNHYPITIRPFDVAGGFDDNYDPLRILQALETIWNGHIAYQDGKIALLPGDYARSTPQDTHVLDDDNIIDDAIIGNTVDSSARYNTVSLGVKACRQSSHHAEVYVRDQQKGGARIVDNIAIIEELQPLAFVNDYYQAQHIARVRAAMHAVRINARRVVTYYTPDNAAWRVGGPMNLTVADAGIGVAKDMVIQKVSKGPNYSIAVEASERPLDDPWAIKPTDAVFDDFTEVEPPLIDQDFLLPPQNFTAERIFGTDRKPATLGIDEVVVRADYPGRGIVAEIEVQVDGVDPPHRLIREPALRSLNDEGDSIVEISFEVDALSAVSVRMRYASEGEETSEWTDLVELARADIVRPHVTGLDVMSITTTGAFVVWIPADYIGHKEVQLRYGTGETPDTDDTLEADKTQVGDDITVTGGTSTYGHQLSMLTAKSKYWVQVRFVDIDDASNPWDESSSVVFTTESSLQDTAPDLAFDAGVTLIDLVQDEEINPVIVLPAVSTSPEDATIVYGIDEPLPAGLIFDPATREMSGTPTDLGTTLLTLRASVMDDVDKATTKLVMIRVSEEDITKVRFQNIVRITSYNFTRRTTITAFTLPRATGPAVIDYILIGTLPDGLTERAGRIIGGTPSATAASETRLTYRASERGNPDNFDEVYIFINVTNVATVAPGVPERLRNSTTNTHQEYLEILWNASETTGAGTAEWYQWRYRLKPASAVAGEWVYGPQLPSVGLRAVIPGLSRGTRYEVQMLAGNVAGQSAWTEGVVMNTLSSDPFRISGDIPAIDGEVNTALATGFILPTAAGGTTPYTHRATHKPSWASIDSDTREVSGTPTVDGLQHITWEITDSGGSAPLLISVTIYIEPAPQSIQPIVAFDAGVTLIDLEKDKELATAVTLPALTTVPADETVTYSIEESLPAGLSFDAATRNISGTPTALGDTLLTLAATLDSDSTARAEKLVLVRVREKVVTDVTFPDNVKITSHNFTRGTTITTFTLPAATGPAVIDYTLIGTLPDGLTLRRRGRRVGGTPSATAASETRLTYRASERGNLDNFAEVLIFINVTDVALVAPGVPERLRNSTTNTHQEYLEILWNASETTGAGTAEWYQWRYRLKPASAVAGEWVYGPQLPSVGLRAVIPGLSRGTRYEVQMLAGNVAGQSAWTEGVVMNTLSSDPFRISGDIPAIDGEVNTALATGFILPTAAGGTTPYTHRATHKPSWASIDSDTREVSGTPTVDGLQHITWEITDSGGLAPLLINVPIYIDPLPPTPVEQIAYQWHSNYTTAPAVTNTQGEQADDDATPSGWSRSKGTAPDGKPYLWTIRRRKNVGTSWTLWGGAEPDAGSVVSGVPASSKPMTPTGVTNTTPVDGSMVVSWTSSGEFFTEVEYEYLESASWHFGGQRVSYGQSVRLNDLTLSTNYRYRVRHRNVVDGAIGDWFDFV